MPYKVFSDGDKFCVHKLDSGGNKGEVMPGGCHPSKSEAAAHARALWASESKEITDATLDLLKEIANDEEDNKPERAQAVLDEWKERVGSIPEDDEDVQIVPEEPGAPESEEQEPAAEQEKETPVATKKGLLSKLKEVGEKIASLFSGDDGAIGGGGYDSGLSIWKEGNLYWWMASYSNKFRDQDKPPEIIASESHENFVRMVKEKEVPLPELWLWHKSNWKVGKAHGVAYDTAGFAVAIGTFDAGNDAIAEALMKSKETLRVSHGMPISSIVRDKADPSIIVRHVTREISPLPAWAAANKLTGFAVLESTKEESTMAIPDETKKEWVESMGIDPKTLDSLEAANAKDADKAISEGLESKETDAASAQPATPAEELAPEVAETPAETPTPATEPNLDVLRAAVTEAVTSLVNPMIERIDQLEATMKEIKETTEKQKEMLVGTPAASLATLITGFAQSAIGAESTRVDGRTSLAKSKPVETAPTSQNGKTLVPFINEITAQ